MKKHFTLILITFILCAVIFVPTSFAKPALVTDGGELLTDAEEAELNDLAEEVSEYYNVDVVIATVRDVPEQRIQQYTEDFYFSCGYGRDDDLSDEDSDRDGIILVFSYFSDDERYFDIFTNDYADYAIGRSGKEYIENKMRSTDRTFYRMCKAYIEACDYLLEQAEEGGSYSEKTAKNGIGATAKIIISLVIGAIAGLITASSKTSPHVKALKSVSSMYGASDYAVPDTFNLTDSHEVFLYSNESRTVRQTSSSSYSSGGRSYSSHSSHSGHHGSSSHRSGRI